MAMSKKKSKKLINKKSVILGVTILLLICVVVIFVHKRTELKNPEWLAEWIEEHRENLIELNYKNMLPEDIVFDIAKTYDVILEKKLGDETELKIMIKEMERLLKYAEKCNSSIPHEQIIKLDAKAPDYHLRLAKILQNFFNKQGKRFSLQYWYFPWGQVYFLSIGKISSKLISDIKESLKNVEFWGHPVDQFNIDVVIGLEIPDIRRLYYYKRGYGAHLAGGHDSLGVILDLSEACEMAEAAVSLVTGVQITEKKIKKPEPLSWELLKRSFEGVNLQDLDEVLFERSFEILSSLCIHELGHALYRKINPWQASMKFYDEEYDNNQVNEIFAFLTEIVYGHSPFIPLHTLLDAKIDPNYEPAYRFISDRFAVSMIYNQKDLPEIDFSMVKKLEYPYDTKEKDAIFQQIYKVRPEELKSIAKAWGKWLLDYLAKAMKEAE